MGFFNWWKTLSGYNNAFDSTSPPELGSINLIKDKKKLIIYHKQLNFVERKPRYLIVDKMVDRKTAWLPIEKNAQNNLKWIVGKNTTVYKTICIFRFDYATDTFECGESDDNYNKSLIACTRKIDDTGTKYTFTFPGEWTATPLSGVPDGRSGGHVWKYKNKDVPTQIVKIGIAISDPSSVRIVTKTNNEYDVQDCTKPAITYSGLKKFNGDEIEFTFCPLDKLKTNPTKYINAVQDITKRKYYLYYKKNGKSCELCGENSDYTWGDQNFWVNVPRIRIIRKWRRIDYDTFQQWLDQIVLNSGDVLGRWVDYSKTVRHKLPICGYKWRFTKFPSENVDDKTHKYIIKKKIKVSYIDFQVRTRKYATTKLIKDKYSYDFRIWFTYNPTVKTLHYTIEIK